MKKTLTTVLALSMTFIMAFALVGCAGGSIFRRNHRRDRCGKHRSR